MVNVSLSRNLRFSVVVLPPPKVTPNITVDSEPSLFSDWTPRMPGSGKLES